MDAAERISAAFRDHAKASREPISGLVVIPISGDLDKLENRTRFRMTFTHKDVEKHLVFRADNETFQSDLEEIISGIPLIVFT